MSTGLKTQTPLQKIQRLAEEIRAAYEALIAGETVAAPAEIRALVGEWAADVLPPINTRINTCHELVKRGLRDEAVAQALEQPDLFEAVKLLDLERFGRENYAAWMKASQAAGLVAPSPPQLDKMADIEAARDRLADLQPLLDQWRRLNFQRAALLSRIKLIREIANRDSDAQSQVWQVMLRDHEAHRLMEIKADLARLRERMAREPDVDVGRIEREVGPFLEELEGDWDTLQPPSELSDRARRLVVEARQRRVDDTLDRLVTELEAAHGKLATDRAAAKETLNGLCEAWNGVLSDRGVIDPSDPRLARVGSIVGYVALLREHQALMAEVGHRVAERPAALRSRITWANELSRMMDRIDDSATRLPAQDVDPRRIEDLSERVADITDEVRREEQLRRVLTVSAAGFVLISIAATAWSAFALNRHRAAVVAAIAASEAAVKKIEAGEDDGKAPDADWSAAVRRDPKASAAIEGVKRAQQKRAGAREAFAKQIDELNNTLAELQAAPRPDPLSPWPEKFAQATKLLANVRDQRMAVTDEERAKLEQPVATLRGKSKDYAVAADDAFEDRVRRLEADLAAVELVLADDVKRAQARIDEAAAELETLRGLATTTACPLAAEGYGGRKVVSDSVATLVSPESKAAKAINGLRARGEVFAGIAARESEADRLLMGEKYAEYADAIRKIADDIGSGPVPRDYTAAARDHVNWQAISEWGKFLAILQDPANLPAERAKELLEKFRAFGPNGTRLASFKEAKPWLDPALERAGANTAEKLNELKTAFIKILESQHGEGVDGVVWEKDVLPYPRYYCLLVDRPLPNQKKSLKFVTGRPDAQKVWPKKSLSFDSEVHDIADSPQKRIAIECRKVIERDRTAGSAIDRLAIDVVRTCSSPWEPPKGEPSLDPCLQAILLRFLVGVAAEGSPCVKSALAQSLADINAGTAANGQQLMLKGVDNDVFVAAIDPEKQNDGAWVHANRAKCEAFVNRVAREVGEAARTIEAREQDVAQRYRELSHYRCVGRLRKLAGGGWTISGGDPDARAGKQLFIAGGASDAHKMVRCVECDAEGGIPPGTEIFARAGDPVFVEIKSDKKG